MNESRRRLQRYAFMKLDARLRLALRGPAAHRPGLEVVQRGRQRGDHRARRPGARAPATSLCTLHRDLGAILAFYLDPARTFPGFGFGEPDGRRPGARASCSTASPASSSARTTASRGRRALVPLRLPRRREHGILHVGMISHLGSMIPVAAGCAFALKQHGTRPGGDQLHRRGRHLDRRLPRGAQHGRGVEAAAGAGDREQPLRLLDPGAAAVRRRAARRPRPGLRHRRPRPWTATTPTRWPTRYATRRRPRPRRRGTDADRGDARPHARPRRGRRLAEGRARRGARALPSPPIRCRPTAARLEAEGVLDAASCASGSTRARTSWSSGAIDRALAAPPSGRRGRVPRRSSPPRRRRGAAGAAPDDDSPPASAEHQVAGRSPRRRGADERRRRWRRSPAAPSDRRRPARSTYLDAIHQALARGDGARPVGGADGPGHRRLRGRLPRHPRAPRALARARARHADRRERHDRHRRRRGAPRLPAGGRDAVRRLRLLRLQPDRQRRRQALLPLRAPLPDRGPPARRAAASAPAPFHSQNPEGWFAHVAGLKVVCPATAARRQGRC